MISELIFMVIFLGSNSRKGGKERK